MPFTVAVVGKGGSGKSMIAGTLARLLARHGDRVLAFDLDLMPGVSMSLGVTARDEPMFTAMAERDSNSGWGWRAMDREVADMVLEQSVLGPDDVRFLQLGKVTTLPPQEALTASVAACYQILRRLCEADSLAGWTLLCDHPAGMTQSTGGWVTYARTFVVVVEPGAQAILTARRLLGLRKSGQVLVVANKTTGPDDLQFIESSLGERVVWSVPSDQGVRAAQRAGLALIDHDPGSPALRALEGLAHYLADEKSREAIDKEAV